MKKTDNKVYFVCGEKRRIGEIAKCKSCQKEFIRRKNAPKNRPKAGFCCVKCKSEWKKSFRIECKCHCCSKILHKTKSKMKCSKHGFQFCSRICKEKSQSIAGNCPEIRPSHYGTEDTCKEYRNVAFRNLDCKCACGISYKEFLVVHHLDGNRKNNKIENLEIVCHNCHAIRHMKWLDGDWHFCPSVLTPRDKIEDLEKIIYKRSQI